MLNMKTIKGIRTRENYNITQDLHKNPRNSLGKNHGGVTTSMVFLSFIFYNHNQGTIKRIKTLLVTWPLGTWIQIRPNNTPFNNQHSHQLKVIAKAGSLTLPQAKIIGFVHYVFLMPCGVFLPAYSLCKSSSAFVMLAYQAYLVSSITLELDSSSETACLNM